MGATTTQQQSLASLSYNKTHKTILSFPQQLPTNQSIKMQFFAIAATFFAAVMAAPSAKPLMDPTTTTVGQAAEQCGVNQKLSCCNGDDASSCSSSCQSARLATLMPAPSAARLTTRLVSSTSTSSATTSSRTSASSVPANKRLAFCGFLQYS